MPARRCALIVIVWFVLGLSAALLDRADLWLVAQSLPADQSTVSEADIDALVQQLGATTYRARQRAEKQLESLGLLAELGKMSVDVYPRPSVAILATGDELVGPGETLGPGQIRNSNETMLTAQCVRAGAMP